MDFKYPGIYKITSPSNKVYVGQAVNIYKRWRTYKSGHHSRQRKLSRSFNKYGVENHVFEVIERCNVDDLNSRERHWQEYYNVIGENGLNLSLVSTEEKRYVHSAETRKKLSENNRGKNHYMFGKKFPKEVNKKKGRSGKDSYWFGKKLDPKSTRIRQLKRSNKVLIIENGKETIFDCTRDCADYLGCTTKNVLYRDKCRISGRKSIGRYKDIYIEILKHKK